MNNVSLKELLERRPRAQESIQLGLSQVLEDPPSSRLKGGRGFWMIQQHIVVDEFLKTASLSQQLTQFRFLLEADETQHNLLKLGVSIDEFDDVVFDEV
jgi:hypothetical protein